VRSPGDGLFEPLDPPAGGVALLRARIERTKRARVRRRRVAGALVAAPLLAAAAYIAILPRTTEAPALFGFSPTRVALGLEARPTEPVTVAPEKQGTVAVQRVALGTDTVLLYLVGSVE
jgi:hypothetical protein